MSLNGVAVCELGNLPPRACEAACDRRAWPSTHGLRFLAWLMLGGFGIEPQRYVPLCANCQVRSGSAEALYPEHWFLFRIPFSLGKVG